MLHYNKIIIIVQLIFTQRSFCCRSVYIKIITYNSYINLSSRKHVWTCHGLVVSNSRSFLVENILATCSTMNCSPKYKYNSYFYCTPTVWPMAQLTVHVFRSRRQTEIKCFVRAFETVSGTGWRFEIGRQLVPSFRCCGWESPLAKLAMCTGHDVVAGGGCLAERWVLL